MLYVLSDGSLASDGTIDNSADGRGKGIWKGDSSDTAATLVPVLRDQIARVLSAEFPEGSGSN